MSTELNPELNIEISEKKKKTLGSLRVKRKEQRVDTLSSRFVNSDLFNNENTITEEPESGSVSEDNFSENPNLTIDIEAIENDNNDNDTKPQKPKSGKKKKNRLTRVFKAFKGKKMKEEMDINSNDIEIEVEVEVDESEISQSEGHLLVGDKKGYERLLTNFDSMIEEANTMVSSSDLQEDIESDFSSSSELTATLEALEQVENINPRLSNANIETIKEVLSIVNELDGAESNSSTSRST